MTDPLFKLFTSPARVKLLRLFLFNPRQSFVLSDITSRARVTSAEARRELRLFESIGLVVHNTRSKKVRYSAAVSFPYTEGLKALLLNAPKREEEIIRLLRGLGSMKLIILSGIFLDEWDGVVDVLIVGDRVKERALREHLKRLEADIGKELRFAVLPTEDFLYRLNMSDKLLRDVLDYPHRIVLDRLNIGIK